MPSVIANGTTLEYDDIGDASDPVLLLIMGLGGQMIAWDDRFVAALGQRGFRVIRFDNRDVGLSKWFDELGVPDIAGAAAGTAAPPEPAYHISDMADDAFGLLAALEVPAAHVVGASMGGMIAQSLAIRHPSAVASLVSIMSTTGDPAVGASRPDVVEALFLAPMPADRAEFEESSVKAAHLIGSPGYPFHEDSVREQAARAYDRAFHPEGTVRQVVAILGSGDRTADLRQLDVPTLVIHGEDDPLIDVSGGRATASAVPGAELWTIPGMGHDLPPELFDPVADRIGAHCLGR